MLDILDKIRGIFPGPRDDQETRYFKITVFLIAGVLVVVSLITVIIFYVNIEGEEQTLVPNVTSTLDDQIDLLEAIQKLQEKGLYPSIQVRNSSQFPRNAIIEQKPNPGTVVKAGRQILLTVSRGSVIDRVGNYVGKNFQEVKLELDSLFSSGEKALLQIQTVQYEVSEKPFGVILQQEPRPGTNIIENRTSYLTLIVSKGQADNTVIAEDYTGHNYKSVLTRLVSQNIPFIVEISEIQNDFLPGQVVSQLPNPNTEILTNTFVQLKINKPVKLENGNHFGIFEYTMERKEIPVDIKLSAKNDDGTKELLSMQHPGGKITIPYELPSETILSLYIFDEKVTEEIITMDDN
ncbi:MAG: PASTA domain-containing protein [Spirochaetales bacterium]|nr:PASTA domain-containing protein [Spirochaetales bacterium]